MSEKNKEIERLNQQFAMQTPEEAAEIGASVDILKSVPGIDPVLALADGGAILPEKGILVTSYIAPNYGGAIRLYDFPNGIKWKMLQDSRQRDGKIQALFKIKEGSLHSLIYENPDFPSKNIEPVDRSLPFAYQFLKFDQVEKVALRNGGRLLDEAATMLEHPFDNTKTRSSTIEWLDLDERGDRPADIGLPVNRVVADREELTRVLAELSFAMGLEAEDVHTLITTVDSKLNPKD